MNYIYLFIIFIILYILYFYLKFNLLHLELYNNINNNYHNINIIQTWKNNDIPHKYLPFINKIKYLNPNSNYMFFTDNDIDKFILDKFPIYYNTYINFEFKIQKIDFFRYLAIYYYGGVYLDLDFNIFKSLKDIYHDYICKFPQELLSNSDIILQSQNYHYLIGNYAFYAPKKHPFLKKIIDNILNKRINIKLNNNDNNYKKYIYYTTGPVMITQSYIDFKNKHLIDVIQPTIFKKYHFGNYGKHLNIGTWK